MHASLTGRLAPKDRMGKFWIPSCWEHAACTAYPVSLKLYLRLGWSNSWRNSFKVVLSVNEFYVSLGRVLAYRTVGRWTLPPTNIWIRRHWISTSGTKVGMLALNYGSHLLRGACLSICIQIPRWIKRTWTFHFFRAVAWRWVDRILRLTPTRISNFPWDH